MDTFSLIGYACSLGANMAGSEKGPDKLFTSQVMQSLLERGIQWDKIIRCQQRADEPVSDALFKSCLKLAQTCEKWTRASQPIVVIGGDHTSAMGTWSGVQQALPDNEPLGLIWLDAHLDSHTPQTSHTHHWHGMPLAHLLGHGDPRFTRLLNSNPKLIPQNVCVIGVRSYEPEELALLTQLKVKLFTLDDIHAEGLSSVLQQAHAHVGRHTQRYGVSLDLDVIDARDAPGVSTPVTEGIAGEHLLAGLRELFDKQPPMALEIAEFNPIRDQQDKTLSLMARLITIFNASLSQPSMSVKHPVANRPGA